MKNRGLLGLLMVMLSSVALAETSSVFNQELATVAGDRSFNVDIMGPDLNIRYGALDGELQIIGLKKGPLNTNVLAYKREIDLDKSSSKNKKAKSQLKAAAYGGLGMVTTAVGATKTTTTSFTIGGTVTHTSGQVIINANPRMESIGPDTYVDLMLGGFYKVRNKELGRKVLLGAEIEVQLSVPTGQTATNFTRMGVRWVPVKNVALDLMLYESDTGLQVPGIFRVNISF